MRQNFLSRFPAKLDVAQHTEGVPYRQPNATEGVSDASSGTPQLRCPSWPALSLSRLNRSIFHSGRKNGVAIGSSPLNCAPATNP
jgi:hypothetical protein